MADATTAQPSLEAETRRVRAYRPSWLDWVTDAVRRLPGPSWVIYLGGGLGLLLLETGIHWSDGTYPVGTFYPFHTALALTGVYFLGLMHLLDDGAAAALVRFRPVLTVNEAMYHLLHYRLTMLPAGPTLLATVLGVAGGLGFLLFTPPATLEQMKLYTSPPAMALEIGLYLFLCGMSTTLIYHTIHQLRLAHHIYVRHTRVSLFELGPLYAFSWVTGRTAVGLILAVYAWTAAIPGALSKPENVALAIGFLLLAVTTFIWPLLGVHHLLEEEKERRQAALARRMEAALAEVHARTDKGAFGEVAALNSTMSGLLNEQTVLDKISTWPWRPDTVRMLVTALLLPIILGILSRVVGRLVTF